MSRSLCHSLKLLTTWASEVTGNSNGHFPLHWPAIFGEWRNTSMLHSYLLDREGMAGLRNLGFCCNLLLHSPQASLRAFSSYSSLTIINHALPRVLLLFLLSVTQPHRPDIRSYVLLLYSLLHAPLTGKYSVTLRLAYIQSNRQTHFGWIEQAQNTGHPQIIYKSNCSTDPDGTAVPERLITWPDLG